MGIDLIFFYPGDYLGSASWITDETGHPVQYIHYAPYGELITNQTTGYDERYKFIGKERDEESGYDNFGARYYIPPLGIWTRPDPLLNKYIDVSPYMYCEGNPIKFVDPDGRKVVYNDETGDCESMVNDYCSQSDMFKTVYKQLVESNNIYTFQFGETKDNADGQFVPSENGGVITLNRESAWSSAIPEETFHALQKDNQGKYNVSRLNLEFEAKVFVIMSGLPTGFYYGMDEAYRSSLLNMDIKEFTQPQSISEYIKQANIYSTHNSNNTIGTPSYWTPTTISPFNLISIIERQK